MTEEMITDEIYDTDQFVYCRICNRPMKLITPAHLMKSHNMTMADYKKQFPDAPLVCKNNINLLSQISLNMHKLKKERNKDDIINQIQKSPSIDDIQIKVDSADFVKKVDDLRTESLKVNYPNTPKDKIYILLYLEEYFGKDKVVNNYFVEKMIVNQYLQYRIVTDISIPHLKIDFEFNNSFWHNIDIRRVKELRDRTLINDGWTIIDIDSRNPTPEDVKIKIESIMGRKENEIIP